MDRTLPHYHGGQVVLVEPCPWCRIDVLIEALGCANATIARLNRRAQAAESAARVTVEECQRKGVSFGRGLANWYAAQLERERDEARGVARVLAHAWRHDSRPPQKDVDRALAYPATPKKQSSE